MKVLGIALLVLLSSTAAGAAPEPDPEADLGPWSTDGALTVPKGRWEIALFGTSRYGIEDDLELALQPFVFFMLPHAEAKLKLWQRDELSFALRPRLSYPTLFLNLVSKEGSGGLLPATTDVPLALQLEVDGIVSVSFHRRQLASLALGLAVAPRTSSDDFPLLDFPFLYPRFAPLYAWGVPRAALNLEGQVIGPIFYGADFRAYLLSLDDVEGEYAFENGLSAEYRFGTSFAVELGLLTSLARYPVGTRLHLLPYLDLRIGF